MQKITYILYDEQCRFCQSWVSYVVRHLKDESTKIASHQSQFASTKLGQESARNTDSVYFIDKAGVIHEKGSAVISILIELRSPHHLIASMLKLIPIRNLNKLYDLVARNRHRFHKVCPHLSESDRNLISARTLLETKTAEAEEIPRLD